MPDSTLRFSNRVESYVKYRPGYPTGVIETLVGECGLNHRSVVADIGSGTGILSQLFLKVPAQVFGVEPNPEMRAAGERLLKHYPNFTSIAGTAEATTLPDQSVDFITAGQAFHWFDGRLARPEFNRILKPDGWVVLIWNERRVDTSPFLRAYEDLLQKFGTDYAAVDHRNTDFTKVADFFAPQPLTTREFENRQTYNFEGVRGRLLSSSYTPEPGQPNYQPMLAALREVYDTYQVNDQVAFDYTTKMYYGHLNSH